MPISGGPGSSGAERFATSAELDTSDAAFDAHVADSTGVHGIADTSALLTTTAASAAYVSEGSAFADIAGYTDVDATGVTECASAINTALATIAAAGQRAYAKGTFKIASTVTIAANADLGDATFNFTGTSGTAVVVGSTSSGTTVHNLQVTLPKINAVAKTVAGWAQVAGTIGCDISNLQSSFVTVLNIDDFETNLRLYGKGAGCVYNTVLIGSLWNGKINLMLDANSTGWCNENLFLGGRFLNDTATEGSNVTGVQQIKMGVCTSPVNNNVWLKPSLEGNAPEYHVTFAGNYNRIIQGRWEATPPKVKWESGASSNVIDGHYGATSITETWVSGAASNSVKGPLRDYVHKSGSVYGIQVLENNDADTSPVDLIVPSGTHAAGNAPTTVYTHSRGARYTNWKNTASTHPEIRIDASGGDIYFGPGTANPTGHLTNLGSGQGQLAVVDSHLWFYPGNTKDLGEATYKPRDIYAGRNVIIGGAIDHDGTTVGFYGTAPIAKQTGVAVSAAGIHAALVALGLIGA